MPIAPFDTMARTAAPRRTSIGRRVFVCGVVAGLLAGGAGATAQAPAAKPDTRLIEARRALTRGDVARAFELSAAYVKARPRDAAGRVLLARVHIERDELDQAYAELDHAVRADPRNIDALAYLGMVSGQLAAGAFERLATQSPDSARVHQLQGESFEVQDRRRDAETAYEAALNVQPDLLDALLPLARLKRMRLACDDAVALYERAEALAPTFDSAYGLAFCLAYMQENSAALSRYEAAVKRDPGAAVAWSGLGTVLVKVGRTADGIAALKRAVAIEPRMSEPWYVLGMAYQAAGDAVLSKQAFARAEELRTAGKQ
jgi:tetratricopeptide (TPR) repeat protein